MSLRDILCAGGEPSPAIPLRDGILARVRLEIPDRHIHTLRFQLLRFLQHLVRLADARRVPQKNLQLALIREVNAEIPGRRCPAAFSSSRSTGLLRNRPIPLCRMLCPTKICVIPRCPKQTSESSRSDLPHPALQSARPLLARHRQVPVERGLRSCAERSGCPTYATIKSP